MKTILKILLPSLFFFGCQQNNTSIEKKTTTVSEKKKVEYNQNLVDELEAMVVIDQIAAGNAFPPEGYAAYSQDEWLVFRDSVFKQNQNRVKEIFDEYGFAGFDLVGKEGSKNFWLMVQHSDHNPDFQNEVLAKMKIEVEKENAEGRIYGLLVDRVKINTGEKQIYGTQVQYNTNLGQAYPKPLADSASVNERRKSLGMEPLEVYLNSLSEMHYKMNIDRYKKMGIMKAFSYPITLD